MKLKKLGRFYICFHSQRIGMLNVNLIFPSMKIDKIASLSRWNNRGSCRWRSFLLQMNLYLCPCSTPLTMLNEDKTALNHLSLITSWVRLICTLIHSLKTSLQTRFSNSLNIYRWESEHWEMLRLYWNREEISTLRNSTKKWWESVFFVVFVFPPRGRIP